MSETTATPAGLPRYVLTTAAAKLVGMNSATIREWIRTGRLPAYRVGGRVTRIAVADLMALFTPLGPGSTLPPHDGMRCARDAKAAKKAASSRD